jgi:hypothetical protein
MKKMFLLFSHKLTADQIDNAKQKLGVDMFISLPDSLQKIWSNVPADLPDLENYLLPLKEYLKQNINKSDYVLIQGDFGATCKIVSFVKQLNAKAIYATTIRNSKDEIINGKVVKTSVFKHIMFREF